MIIELVVVSFTMAAMATLGLGERKRMRKISAGSFGVCDGLVKKALLPIVAAFLVAISPSVATATLISFDFEGFAENSVAGSTIEQNDLINAAFTIDTLAPLSAGNSILNRYDLGVTSSAITLDGITPQPLTSISTFVSVFNGNTLAINFNFDGTSSPFTGAPMTFARLEIRFSASGLLGNGNDLSTLNETLLNTLDPVQFTVRNTGLGQSGGTNVILGSPPITDPSPTVAVSEPSTLIILSFGLILLALRSRRRFSGVRLSGI